MLQEFYGGEEPGTDIYEYPQCIIALRVLQDRLIIFYAIQIFHLGCWASLALLGMAAIVVASTVESHGYRIKLMLTAWKTKHGEWDY